MMKYIVVTSRVTYVPKNYLGFLQSLLEASSLDLRPSAIVLLNNLDRSLIKGLVGTLFLGAWRLHGQLWINLLSSLLLRFDVRVRLAKRLAIPVLLFPHANDPRLVEWISRHNIDLVVNARTRHIYKQALLKEPRLGCINIHHGLLPEYRGTMCDLYALANDRPAGFSIHRMAKKIDDGEILVVRQVSKDQPKYLTHLRHSSLIEGHVLADLLKIIKAGGGLPKGHENKSDTIIYSKTPTFREVLEMKKRGLKL